MINSNPFENVLFNVVSYFKITLNGSQLDFKFRVDSEVEANEWIDTI